MEFYCGTIPWMLLERLGLEAWAKVKFLPRFTSQFSRRYAILIHIILGGGRIFDESPHAQWKPPYRR